VPHIELQLYMPFDLQWLCGLLRDSLQSHTLRFCNKELASAEETSQSQF